VLARRKHPKNYIKKGPAFNVDQVKLNVLPEKEQTGQREMIFLFSSLEGKKKLATG
jgi:hypothetical protein